MPRPDDRPLTIEDIEDEEFTLAVLAERVATHLDGEWETRRMARHDAMLTGPDGTKLLFAEYGNAPYDPHRFYIVTFTATARPRSRDEPMNVFTLPSQIAAHLKAKTLPEARKRIEAARRQQAVLQERNGLRKARIKHIAEQLDWNSSSYKCHSSDPYPSLSPRVGRRRSRQAPPPVLKGHIGYDDDGTMHMHLAGLPEALVDHIVNILATSFPEENQK